MKFINPYISELDKIQLLQRWILVHSYLYYELDDATVSDEMFDNNCKQLKQMLNKNKATDSRYYKIFIGFDGNTGFDLYSKTPKELRKLIQRDAEAILKRRRENGQ